MLKLAESLLQPHISDLQVIMGSRDLPQPNLTSDTIKFTSIKLGNLLLNAVKTADEEIVHVLNSISSKEEITAIEEVATEEENLTIDIKPTFSVSPVPANIETKGNVKLTKIQRDETLPKTDEDQESIILLLFLFLFCICVVVGGLVFVLLTAVLLGVTYSFSQDIPDIAHIRM